MADLVNIPQFAFPFRVNGANVAVIEQDSAEDRIQNAEIVIRYMKGQRTAIPEFGIPDQTFQENGVDVGEVVLAVQQWEPDADVEVIKGIIEDGVEIATVTISAQGGKN